MPQVPSTKGATRTVVVIGFGNCWHGDDAAGPLVLQRLEDRLSGLPGSARARLTLINCPQLLPELAEPLASADRALFVDAGVDQAPGAITCRRLRAEAGAGRTLGHTFLPSAVLHLADAAFGHAPASLLYTIGASRLELDADLSPEVGRAVEQLADRLASRIVRLLGK